MEGRLDTDENLLLAVAKLSPARRALLGIAPKARWKDRARRAAPRRNPLAHPA